MPFSSLIIESRCSTSRHYIPLLRRKRSQPPLGENPAHEQTDLQRSHRGNIKISDCLFRYGCQRTKLAPWVFSREETYKPCRSRPGRMARSCAQYICIAPEQNSGEFSCLEQKCREPASSLQKKIKDTAIKIWSAASSGLIERTMRHNLRPLRNNRRYFSISVLHLGTTTHFLKGLATCKQILSSRYVQVRPIFCHRSYSSNLQSGESVDYPVLCIHWFLLMTSISSGNGIVVSKSPLNVTQASL